MYDRINRIRKRTTRQERILKFYKVMVTAVLYYRREVWVLSKEKSKTVRRVQVTGMHFFRSVK